jgi:hypothetical protein
MCLMSVMRWNVRVLSTAPITAPYFDETPAFALSVAMVDMRSLAGARNHCEGSVCEGKLFAKSNMEVPITPNNGSRGSENAECHPGWHCACNRSPQVKLCVKHRLPAWVTFICVAQDDITFSAWISIFGRARFTQITVYKNRQCPHQIITKSSTTIIYFPTHKLALQSTSFHSHATFVH